MDMPDIIHPQHLKTEPWNHQIEAYRWAMPRRGTLLALRMGEGKTLVAIGVTNNVRAMRTLVVGPASALGVWKREYEQHSAIRTNVVILNRGNTADKVKRAGDELVMAKSRNEPLVLVVNYETAIRAEFQKFALSKLWDVIICDEIHRIKDPVGVTGKFFGKLGATAKKKLGLSGTPMPHSPLDLFSLYRFLDPSVFGWSWVEFRQRYAKFSEVFRGKVETWLNEGEMKEKFAKLAFRVEEDVLDLPPFTEQHVTCELSPKAMEIYRELEEELIAEVDAGVVTAANALVKLLRLQQVASGFVTTEDGVTQQIDDSKERLLGGLLEDIDRTDPVVVFCRFKHDLDVIQRVAESLGRRYGEISGRRKDLTDHATMPDGIDLMGVQIQAGGAGIDLTRARYAFYFSIGFNWGDFQQSEARIHRPGQTRTCHYYHLLADGTVDYATYGALAKRGDLVENVLSALKRPVENLG